MVSPVEERQAISALGCPGNGFGALGIGQYRAWPGFAFPDSVISASLRDTFLTSMHGTFEPETKLNMPLGI